VGAKGREVGWGLLVGFGEEDVGWFDLSGWGGGRIAGGISRDHKHV